MGRAGLSGVVTSALGWSVVERVSVKTTAGRLRILAYHGIPDPAAFSRQLDHLAETYHPVSGAEATHVIASHGTFPERAVWVTFDDGRPEVVHDGLPLLAERNVPATMYVCPGVIDTTEPYWWDVVALADARQLPNRVGTTALKHVPDDERRSHIQDLTQALTDAGVDVSTPQLTSEALRRWHDAGMEIGNHTWDHPLLDQCSDQVQIDQIGRAHDALAALGVEAKTFAYPNGNVTAIARSCVARLGYSSAVDFAHRLCSSSADLLTLPRLRIDTDASMPRFRAIVGGAHSGVFHVTRRSAAAGVSAQPV